jgi:hypothetical protein
MSIFTEVQQQAPPTNSFDLSHDVKLSLDMGNLVPVACMEVLPGDKFNVSSSIMARMAPMIAPVMHKVDVDLQHFFVPNRLIWDNWEKFITTGTPDGSTPAHPYFSNITALVPSTLADYLGLPLANLLDKFSALPFAAYQMIYNEYYRDQNLQAEVNYKLVDGANNANTSLFTLRQRAWEHDYFTSALPFAQKGNPVALPLGTSAPIKYQANNGDGVTIRNAAGLGFYSASALASNASAHLSPTTTSTTNLTIDPNGTLYADLTQASAVTINSLRYAVRLQEFLERNARGGTRYIEHILSHFGVRSSDKRLQRPEFLGGSRQAMVISEVLQSSETTTTPQGTMAGHGISVSGGKNFSYYAEEHGFILSIVSIRPKTAYQQGMPRMWSRFDPLKYAFPTFANLGEQEILNREIFFGLDGVVNDQTFGYTPRYSEYKYQDSRVAGDFKTTLSFWHLGRIFPSRPALNSSFITADPSKRIFAVQNSTNSIYMHILHSIKVRRRLPKFGIPTL